MEGFKERLQIEAEELREKLVKLNHFIAYANEFEELETVQKELLRIQSSAMSTYLSCLVARLNTLS